MQADKDDVGSSKQTRKLEGGLSWHNIGAMDPLQKRLEQAILRKRIESEWRERVEFWRAYRAVHAPGVTFHASA